MNKIFYVFLLVSFSLWSQSPLEQLLAKYNDETVPYLSIKEMRAENFEDIVLLDAREPKEYNVSHIKNAHHIGYNKFDIKAFRKLNIPKNKKIIVYCSLGIRSEDIASKIQAIGYTNVYNLFGGIFEWKNNNLPVVDTQNQLTDNVHTFSKSWGKWLTKGTKIY